MLTIFVKTGCPYCAMVLKRLADLEIPYDEKNISEDAHAAELVERGGKRQVPFVEDEDPCATAGHHTPCLVDGDVEMYESADIVAYLDKNYGPEKDDKSESITGSERCVEKGGETCSS